MTFTPFHLVSVAKATFGNVISISGGMEHVLYARSRLAAVVGSNLIMTGDTCCHSSLHTIKHGWIFLCNFVFTRIIILVIPPLQVTN